MMYLAYMMLAVIIVKEIFKNKNPDNYLSRSFCNNIDNLLSVFISTHQNQWNHQVYLFQ